MARIKKREEVEDIFQAVLCKLVPQISPKNIRPAYQQQDYAGQNQYEDGLQTYNGFTPNDNFIYFTAHFNTQPIQPTVENGRTYAQRGFYLKLSVYGPDSASIAVIITNLMYSNPVREYLQKYGFYISTIDDITEMHELFGEQWYERDDVNIYYNEIIEIINPMIQDPNGNLLEPEIAEHAEVVFNVE